MVEIEYCVKSPFTPLESPAACSGDEDLIPFRANTGFNAPCEPPRWKVEDFLTGFTLIVIPGLTRNPVFLSWLPACKASSLEGFPLEFTPHLIRGGNDGFRIYVKKRWTHFAKESVDISPAQIGRRGFGIDTIRSSYSQ